MQLEKYRQLNPKVFCIDPGIGSLGWCICEGNKIIEKGAIKTKSDISLYERILHIINSIELALKRNGECNFFLEDINFIKRGREKSSIGIIMVMGAIIYKFSPKLVNPFSVRKKLLNSARASKEDIISFVQKYYSEEISNHNIADALLISIYASLEDF